jgi:tetratricopeptide (TPR) repeat protein
MLLGNDAAAEKDARIWLANIEDRSNDDDHFIATRFLAELLITTGRTRDAMEILDHYLDRTTGWIHDTSDVNETFYVQQYKYLLGGMPDIAYTRLRDAWIQSENQRAGSEPPTLWVFGYAAGVRSRSQALEAMRELKGYGMPDPLTRIPRDDYYIGKMLIAAGKPDEAIPHLERASRACHAVKSPWATTMATTLLARTLDDANERDRACEMYRRLIRRWGGPNTHFVDGIAAKRRFETLRCPADLVQFLDTPR